MEAAMRQFDSETVHRGPNLAILAIAYTILSLVSSIIAFAISRGTLPPPYGVGLQPRFYVGGYLSMLRIAAFLQFAAAIPLGVFAATAVSRLRFLRLNVAGVFIALFGGFAAALFMAFSGLFQWALSQRALATLPGATLIVHFLSFAMGGIGFVVTFGLFVAGISVIAWFTNLLPPWLAAFGMVIVALAAVAGLTLLFNALAFLLPVVHYLGFAWIIAAGLLFPRTRPAVGEAKFPVAA